MKPRIKKILIVLGTLVVLVISKRIYNTTNYDFNYLQKTNQTLKAQNVFWDRDVNAKFDMSTEAYDFSFSRWPDEGFKSFTLDLNKQYYAYYSNKVAHSNRDDIFSISISPMETGNDSSPIAVYFLVDRKDFSIVDESKYDDPNSEIAIPGMTIEERKDLMNLAIQRFKEVQEKYYDSKK